MRVKTSPLDFRETWRNFCGFCISLVFLIFLSFIGGKTSFSFFCRFSESEVTSFFDSKLFNFLLTCFPFFTTFRLRCRPFRISSVQIILLWWSFLCRFFLPKYVSLVSCFFSCSLSIFFIAFSKRRRHHHFHDRWSEDWNLIRRWCPCGFLLNRFFAFSLVLELEKRILQLKVEDRFCH